MLTGWLGCAWPARGRAWAAGGDPDVDLLVIDVDATLVLAHSDFKEGAEGTYKHTFGFKPYSEISPPEDHDGQPGRQPARDHCG
jgi:hypothetical protein